MMGSERPYRTELYKKNLSDKEGTGEGEEVSAKVDAGNCGMPSESISQRQVRVVDTQAMIGNYSRSNKTYHS